MEMFNCGKWFIRYNFDYNFGIPKFSLELFKTLILNFE